MFAKKQKVLEDFFYHLAQEQPALHANFYVSQFDNIYFSYSLRSITANCTFCNSFFVAGIKLSTNDLKVM